MSSSRGEYRGAHKCSSASSLATQPWALRSVWTPVPAKHITNLSVLFPLLRVMWNPSAGDITKDPARIESDSTGRRLDLTARAIKRTATPLPRSHANVGTVADCYRADGRGEDREDAGVKHAEVTTARIVQDERGWLRVAG